MTKITVRGKYNAQTILRQIAEERLREAIKAHARASRLLSETPATPSWAVTAVRAAWRVVELRLRSYAAADAKCRELMQEWMSSPASNGDVKP